MSELTAATAALIDAIGMFSENLGRIHDGHALAHSGEAFALLADRLRSGGELAAKQVHEAMLSERGELQDALEIATAKLGECEGQLAQTQAELRRAQRDLMFAEDERRRLDEQLRRGR